MPTRAEIESAKKKWLKANRAYHSEDGVAIMSDADFDKLENMLRKYVPEWGPLHSTGVIDAAKEDVQLPHFMPSLGKHYPEEIEPWIASKSEQHGDGAQYLLMDKLDGSSLILGYRRGKPFFLATRGDGETGGDISFLLPFMNVPKKLSVDAGYNMIRGDVYFRCEALMKNDVFAAKYSVAAVGEKDGKKTARAAVAGLLNSTGEKIDANKLHDIDIVVLGVFSVVLGAGLDWACDNGFQTVTRKRYQLKALSAVVLDGLLIARRNKSPYDLDGIVIAPYLQNFNYKDNKRPKWGTAFKRNADVEDAPQAKVKKIIWQLSHAGKWTPKIKIEPIIIDGVEVTHATAHNARWMKDFGIGPGAVVRLLRSGEVIPKIVGVDKRAAALCWPDGPTEWRGAFLYSTVVTPRMRVKRLARFLERLGVEDIAEKNVILLHDAGVTTLTKMVLFACRTDKEAYRFLTRSAGMGDAKSKRLIEQFPKILDADLRSFMLASSCFENIDASRFDMIETVIPLRDLIYKSRDDLYAALLPVRGFKDKTIDRVYEGLQEFVKLFEKVQNLIKLPTQEKTRPAALSNGRWVGKTACFTGYRNKAQEQEFIENGGKIVSGVSKSLSVLFYDPEGKPSSKVAKAKSLGVLVSTWADFTN